MELDNMQQKPEAIQRNRKNANNSKNSHKLSMTDCEKLELEGVIDVKSFDTQEVILETRFGILTVKGEELKVNKLNIENEELYIDGRINNLTYSNINSFGKKSGSFVKRMFK